MLIGGFRYTFIDNVNLLFHEAGHLVFAIFGSEFLGFLGGTLMQLMVPIAITTYFWKNHDPFAFWVGLFWISQNILNVAHYLGDANTQILPLLGGGQHDWHYLLSRLNILPMAEEIGIGLKILGYAMMAWIFYKLFRLLTSASSHTPSFEGVTDAPVIKEAETNS